MGKQRRNDMGLDVYIKRISKPAWRNEFGMTMPSSWYDQIRGENIIRLTEETMKDSGHESLREFAVPVRVLQSYIDLEKIADEFTGGVPVFLGSAGFCKGKTSFVFYPESREGLPDGAGSVALDREVIEKDYTLKQLEPQYVFDEETLWHKHGEEDKVRFVIYKEIYKSTGQTVDNLGYYRIEKNTAKKLLQFFPGLFTWTPSDEAGETGLFYKEWY